MFNDLQRIMSKPEPFSVYTASELWTDEHTSKKMLEYHLNENIDLSSRNKKFIQQSVDWIISKFKVHKGTKIADFGCGPGLYTTKFAETGAEVTGIDFSKRSLNYARDMAKQKGLDIDYIHADYLEFETDKRFDLITMIFCDFCALSPLQRMLLLSKFHQFLNPGGAILIDVHSFNIFNSTEESTTCIKNQLDGFWSSDDYYAFLNTFKYKEEKVTLDKYTIIEKNKEKTIYNWLQYFSPETIAAEFERNGFVVDEYYSDVAGTPWHSEATEIGLVGKKA